MAKRPPLPMSRADRAKQFAPFSALGGLDAALERKQQAAAVRRTPSEEEAKVLNSRLLSMSAGDRVYVMYYTKKGYVKRNITVDDIDISHRVILTDGELISFDDIYAVKLF